jgi:hypothetical protein
LEDAAVQRELSQKLSTSVNCESVEAHVAEIFLGVA